MRACPSGRESQRVWAGETTGRVSAEVLLSRDSGWVTQIRRERASVGHGRAAGTRAGPGRGAGQGAGRDRWPHPSSSSLGLARPSEGALAGPERALRSLWQFLWRTWAASGRGMGVRQKAGRAVGGRKTIDQKAFGWPVPTWAAFPARQRGRSRSARSSGNGLSPAVYLPVADS